MEYEDIGPQPNKRPIYTFPRCNTPRPSDSFFSNFPQALDDWLKREIPDFEEEKEECNKNKPF